MGVAATLPELSEWTLPLFSRLKRHLNRETPIYAPFAISLMHFFDKSVGYYVND